jgi:hypothetical protein
LIARFGTDAVQVDNDDARSARVVLDEVTIEVGFAGIFRMFGALIDTQWVGVRGSGSAETILEYRFDKKKFLVKTGSDTALEERLSDATTGALAARSELKKLRVEDGAASRRVVITPLAGTITAVYVPPMPPYSVPMKIGEANDHIELLLHLLDKR